MSRPSPICRWRAVAVVVLVAAAAAPVTGLASAGNVRCAGEMQRCAGLWSAGCCDYVLARPDVSAERIAAPALAAGTLGQAVVVVGVACQPPAPCRLQRPRAGFLEDASEILQQTVVLRL